MQFFQLITRLLHLIIKLIQHLFVQVIRLISYPAHWRQKIFAFTILIVCILLIFASLFWRGSHTFEGNLLVQEMSFTYAGTQEKLFINTINDIKNLELSGKQNITFSGDFTKNLDSKLKQLKQITINLHSANSKVIITPLDSKKSSEIQLLELRLQPNTESQLGYNSVGILSLCLQSQDQTDSLCLDNNKPTISLSKILGTLQLELGTQPLKVSLENYIIPQLQKKDSPENPVLFDFIFTPAVSQMEFSLTPPTSLYVSLPKLSEADQSEWLRGNLKVKNVKFSRLDQTGDIQDKFDISTIVNGKIRMAEQDLEVKPNQFLMIGEPGIELIRYFQIKSKPTPGLEVRFSGKSKEIGVGLDPKFIVDSIRPNFLTKYLSKDAITVLLSFCAAVAGSLLSLLFANAFESKSKS